MPAAARAIASAARSSRKGPSRGRSSSAMARSAASCGTRSAALSLRRHGEREVRW